MEIEDYSSLNDSITQVSQKSKTELIEEALGSISVDGQKPCVCLLRTQHKLSECHLTLNKDVIKQCLMKAMPISTRSSLSANFDLSPNKFAKLAAPYTVTPRTRSRKTGTFTLHSNHRLRRMHASCFSLTPPNDLSPGVCGLDPSPHILKAHPLISELPTAPGNA